MFSPTATPRPASDPGHLSVAIIGGGPTSVYLLSALSRSPRRLDITVFEREAAVGPGMPFREGMNEAMMLANVASRELPPVTRTLSGFLRDCDDAELADLGVARDAIDDEAFHPRLVLGAYFVAEVAAVVARLRGLGHRIEMRTRTRVADIAPAPGGIRVTWRGMQGTGSADFDHAVIATGHDWPDQRLPNGVQLLSPWPASKLRRLSGRIGILGSSLTAIDVAVAIAARHGRFVTEGRRMVYTPGPGEPPFELVMMSRKGLLPEADWFYPIPTPPLPTLTGAAVEAEVARGPDGLLDRAFALFSADMAALDPDYATRVGVDAVEGYAERHFATRLATDPWDWARADLAEAARNRRRRHTVQWRYGLLAAHEVLEEVTPHLTEADLDRFRRHLVPVFVDIYASVPHRSIRRLLALRDAGLLRLTALGGDPRIEPAGREVRVRHAAGDETVAALVDARGQQPTSVSDLGFPSLARRGAVRPMRGDDCVLPLTTPTPGTLHCLSLPVLLKRRPFVQGLVNVHALAEATAQTILDAAPAEVPRVA
jgi:uncharacterized NAD(P)/FAD-binding protein YdhS